MIPLIPLAMQLLPLVPKLAGLLAGDKAGDVASKIVTVAKIVTGIDDPEKAVAAAQNPDNIARIKEALAGVAIAEVQAETDQLRIVNKTMQAEIASGDKFVSRHRPTYSYVLSYLVATLGTVFAWLMVTDPDRAVAMLNSLVSAQLVIAAVLAPAGITMWGRSKEKIERIKK